MLKNFLSIYFAVLMVLLVVIPVPVNSEMDKTITMYRIGLVSDVIGQSETSIEIYVCDNIHYIPLDIVGKLTNKDINYDSSNPKIATIDDGVRKIRIDVNNKNIETTYFKNYSTLTPINALYYKDDIMVEAVPFLKYLGANVGYLGRKDPIYKFLNESLENYDGCLICNANNFTVWKTFDICFDNIDDTFLNPYKNWSEGTVNTVVTCDVLFDFFSDLNFSKSVDDYYERAIFSMLDANPYAFPSVKGQNNEINENFNYIFNIGDTYTNSVENALSNANDFFDIYMESPVFSTWVDSQVKSIRNQIIAGYDPTALESSYLSDDITDSISEIGEKIEKADKLVSFANIANSYLKNTMYAEDTIECLQDALDAAQYTYADLYFDQNKTEKEKKLLYGVQGYEWWNAGQNVNSVLQDNRENLLKSFKDYLKDKFYEKLEDAASNLGGATLSNILFSVKAGVFVANFICEEDIVKAKTELDTMFLYTMLRSSYYNSYELVVRMENENCQNKDTIVHTVNMLKFYFRLCLPYYDNVKNLYGIGQFEALSKNQDTCAFYYNALSKCVFVDESVFDNQNDYLQDNYYEEVYDSSVSMGRYVGDSWRIDVMDSQITVEMISDGEAVSIVNHSGVISNNMTFEETDRFSKNRYEVTFDGDNIHLTANCIEFYNELAGWAIPDTDVTLSKISDTVPDMDISQWSNEKLASAINYYMSRRDYTNGYYVVPNEIQHNDDGIKVYAHNGLGNSKNEYYVNGAKGNDIVCLALNYTGIAEFFHLTDCDSSYKSPYLNSVKIYSCDKKGEINGTDVAGFTTSYVCEGGSVAYVRKVLGDKWHITAKQYCQSKGLTWYELYDTDDGDYYGWVDANYIRFYDDNPTSTESGTAKTWKEAYQNALNDFKSSVRYENDSMWDLIDLDNDGIPELFISEGQAIVRCVYMYYYQDGKAVPVDSDSDGNPDGLGSMGAIAACKEEGIIQSGYYDQGIESSVINHYSNHKLTMIESFYNDEGACDSNATYEVNGNKVTIEEYNKAVQDNQTRNWVRIGQRYEFDDFSPLK